MTAKDDGNSGQTGQKEGITAAATNTLNTLTLDQDESPLHFSSTRKWTCTIIGKTDWPLSLSLDIGTSAKG